jgi:hypothetical protein
MKRCRPFACSLIAVLSLLPFGASAQEAQTCGLPPSLSSVISQDDTVKGELKGEANLLKTFVGKAELGGEVLAAKKKIYQSSDQFMAAQKDAYLEYIFCVVLLQDKSLDVSKKLDAIQTFKGAPRPNTSLEPPLKMSFIDSDMHLLDGYKFAQSPSVRSNLMPGTILPVGARARLLFQAGDPEEVTEVEKVALITTYYSPTASESLQYSVDPSSLSGFGQARPHTFKVRLSKAKTEVSYVRDGNGTSIAKPSNLLAATPSPLLRFDRNAGLQETLEFDFEATDKGLYEVQLKASAVSSGALFELATKPFYIVKQ